MYNFAHEVVKSLIFVEYDRESENYQKWINFITLRFDNFTYVVVNAHQSNTTEKIIKNE